MRSARQSQKRRGWPMRPGGDAIGLGEGEGAAEQGAAGDHAGDIRQIGERRNIVERLDHAAGNDRYAHLCGEVRYVRHAAFGVIFIAVDVGIDDGRQADILELMDELDGREGRRFGPPFDDDPPAAHIDADHDGIGIGPGGGLDEVRIFDRRRCDDDPGGTRIHPRVHFFHRPDGAADLHRTPGGADDFLDDGGVLSLVEDGIEIDHMQPRRALPRQIVGGLYRIDIIDQRAVDPVAHQIDEAALAQFEIGIDDHVLSLAHRFVAATLLQYAADEKPGQRREHGVVDKFEIPLRARNGH